MVSTETVTETVVLIVVPPLQAIQLCFRPHHRARLICERPLPGPLRRPGCPFGARLQLGSPDWGDWCFLSSLARSVGSAWDATGRPIDKSDDATRPVARGARQQAGHALGAGRPEHRLLGLVRRRPGAAACPDSQVMPLCSPASRASLRLSKVFVPSRTCTHTGEH
jgi:hypothetical protein